MVEREARKSNEKEELAEVQRFAKKVARRLLS
jgi:hypothetical protein